MSWLGYGTETVKAGPALTLAELQQSGGSGEVENEFNAQGVIKHVDSAWIRSTISPGTHFRVQVADGDSVEFGTLTGARGSELVFAQAGDSRMMRSGTFVAKGTRVDTISVQPGSQKIEKKEGDPVLKPVTLRFFLGDSKTPVPVFDGNAETSADYFTFNPLTAADAPRANRLQNLRVVSAKDRQTGDVTLRVFQHVNPSCGDILSDGREGCAKGARTCFSGTVTCLTATGQLGRAAVVNTFWGIRHPVLAGQSMLDGAITLAGGTPPDRGTVVEKTHTE